MPKINFRCPIQRDNQTFDLIGTLYPQDSRAPLAVLLHGFPGSNKNYPLAETLHQQGWHVLIPHFAGSWGSGGDYDMRQQPADARAALDAALATLSADSERVVLIGYSLGTRAALLCAADDSRVKAVVALAGICDFEDMHLAPEFYQEAAQSLPNTTPDQLSQQWTALGQGLQPLSAMQSLAPRPVLVVHGTADEVVPFFHADCFASMGGAHVQRVTIEGADHGFGAHQTALYEAMSMFLSQL